uniref:Kinase family protein n=1 Tax=Rhizophora mucronata TaxID=61149 RepID=A0A2P2LST2_RHIMU
METKKKKWLVYMGVGIGVALLLLLLLILSFWYRKSHEAKPPPVSPSASKMPKSTEPGSIPDLNTKSWSLSSHGLQYAVEYLTVYKLEDLQIATDYFSQANKIKGSVYRGSFKGDAAAVKIMKGDVSAEINILKMISHSNIIRLSGFCLHHGNTYLVYEYAESGSLSDRLRNECQKAASLCLDWKQRVQIAYDVADALNYLHNYTNPPYIHKNLKSSNILLDANLRAKISNFGLARALEEEDSEGGLQLTRHVVGTQGYMPPEYIENGVITPKLDVFAFGVVMLELLSGKEAAAGGDKNAGEELLCRSISLVLDGDNVREKLRGFMDPFLRDEYPFDLAFSMAQLAKTCVAHDLNARPSMPQVFMIMSKILSSSLDWDPSNELERSTTLSLSR